MPSTNILEEDQQESSKVENNKTTFHNDCTKSMGINKHLAQSFSLYIVWTTIQIQGLAAVLLKCGASNAKGRFPREIKMEPLKSSG